MLVVKRPYPQDLKLIYLRHDKKWPMEQAAAVRGELATVRPQRLWLNTLCRESEVDNCFVVSSRGMSVTDQTFAGKRQAEVAFALINLASRVQHRNDHVPHFASTADFAWLKTHVHLIMLLPWVPFRT